MSLLSIDTDTAAEHLQEEGGFSEKEAGAIVDLLTGAADGTPEESEEAAEEKESSGGAAAESESDGEPESEEEESEGLSFVDRVRVEEADEPTDMFLYTLFGEKEAFQSPSYHWESKTEMEVEIRKSVHQRLEYILEYINRREGPDLSKSEYVERVLDFSLRVIELNGEGSVLFRWFDRGPEEKKWEIDGGDVSLAEDVGLPGEEIYGM